MIVFKLPNGFNLILINQIIFIKLNTFNSPDLNNRDKFSLPNII